MPFHSFVQDSPTGHLLSCSCKMTVMPLRMVNDGSALICMGSGILTWGKVDKKEKGVLPNEMKK